MQSTSLFLFPAAQRVEEVRLVLPQGQQEAYLTVSGRAPLAVVVVSTERTQPTISFSCLVLFCSWWKSLAQLTFTATQGNLRVRMVTVLHRTLPAYSISMYKYACICSMLCVSSPCDYMCVPSPCIQQQDSQSSSIPLLVCDLLWTVLPACRWQLPPSNHVFSS